MGGFDEATYNAVIQEINDALKELSDLIVGDPSIIMADAGGGSGGSGGTSFPSFGDIFGWVVDKASAAFDWLAGAASWVWDQIVKIVQGVIDLVQDCLKGYYAPIWFFIIAISWSNNITGPMNSLSAAINPIPINFPSRTGKDKWEGDGAEHYHDSTATQEKAAKGISDMGSGMSVILRGAALSGFGFYVALAIIIVQFGAVIAAAIAACFTGVGAVPGAAAVAVDGAASTAAIVALTVALGTALGGCATAVYGLTTTEDSHMDSFHKGKWPPSVI